MTDKYSTEELEKIFKEHAKKNNRQNEIDIENFKFKYPDSELPNHYLNYFNISEAFHVICKEINVIKLSLSKGLICKENNEA